MNDLVKNFPFVYLCDGREGYDNFVCLFYDKKEGLNFMSSDEQIIASIFGFVPKEFLNNYTTSFFVNLLENSERFERASKITIAFIQTVQLLIGIAKRLSTTSSSTS